MRPAILVTLIFAAVTFIYSYRLGVPEDIYYDEVYHVKTARQFQDLSGNYENTHPPLGKMFIALAIKVFGDKAWAWRFFPVLAGLGTLLVFQRLAKRALQDENFAWVATLLLGLDGMAITQARIAMLNTFMTFFMMLTVLFAVRIIETDGERKREFIFCGLALGLAAGSRWIGIGVLPILGLLYLKNFQKFRPYLEFFNTVMMYLVLPAILIYFGTHLILPFIKGYDWWDLWDYQFGMMRYHAQLTAGHNYGSDWWGWPLMIRPIWYFFERREGLVYGILCLSNPAVMWALIPAMGYAAWRFVRERNWICALLILGFLSQWLPWALIGRVKFFHYFYPAMPFVVLAITMALKALWDHDKYGKIAVAAYLTLVLIMFGYWYPLYTAYPISPGFFSNHLWFKSWV
jgi:dolichyl-phosphate-mannose-protein mannosyltransferase